MTKSEGNIPWPEYDEYEYYDVETSFLKTLFDEWEDAGNSTWAGIARELNNKFGNNRTGPQCKRKCIKEGWL